MPKGYIVIAFTCYSYKTDNVEISIFCSSSLCNFQNNQTRSKVFRTSQEFSVFFLGHDAVYYGKK